MERRRGYGGYGGGYYGGGGGYYTPPGGYYTGYVEGYTPPLDARSGYYSPTTGLYANGYSYNDGYPDGGYYAPASPGGGYAGDTRVTTGDGYYTGASTRSDADAGATQLTEIVVTGQRPAPTDFDQLANDWNQYNANIVEASYNPTNEDPQAARLENFETALTRVEGILDKAAEASKTLDPALSKSLANIASGLDVVEKGIDAGTIASAASLEAAVSAAVKVGLDGVSNATAAEVGAAMAGAAGLETGPSLATSLAMATIPTDKIADGVAHLLVALFGIH